MNNFLIVFNNKIATRYFLTLHYFSYYLSLQDHFSQNLLFYLIFTPKKKLALQTEVF